MAGAVKDAASGTKHRDAGVNADPNVIPFIDIMLVLLIIFMVAAPPPTVDIKVDLPPPNAVPPPQAPLDKPTFVFLYDENGVLTYNIGERQVTFEELPEILEGAARLNNPTMRGDDERFYLEAKIFVRADQDTAYANVISLMGTINEAGFQAVSIVAEEADF